MARSRLVIGGLLLMILASIVVLAPALATVRLTTSTPPPGSVAGPATAPTPSRATLTVFAAASLTDAFKEIGAIFEMDTGVPVTFNFGASSQLRTQLEQGAPADVYASADQAQMDRARQSGLLDGPDAPFAGNRLVIITPKRNPAAIQSAADLGTPGVKVVTAAPEVPVGAYTQAIFEKMSQVEQFGADFQDRANANVVSREPNVRQIVAKILLGEGDAAVVYRSDVTPQSAPDLLVIPIPDEVNTTATYPIALVADAGQPELGRAFVALVQSPVGQGILQSRGFTPVGPAALAPVPSGDGAARP